MSRLFELYFKNKSLISAAGSFLPPLSVVHRLQNLHLDTLLPATKPSSRSLFERRSAAQGIRAHCLWLVDEGREALQQAAGRKTVAGGASTNRNLGRRGKLLQEAEIKKRLNAFSQLVTRIHQS